MVSSKEFNPLVSIVIPVYNGSNYLREAIDSALAQTYENLEILIINDGSTDNGATEKIAKSYGDKIRYFSKENGGVATALNLGIKKMKGEYFSWLSHDDLYYPHKVERQVEFIRNLKDRKVFLYADYALLRAKKLSPVKLDHEMLKRKERYALLRGCVNGITVLIPKVIFDEVGNLDPSLRCTQDYDLWRKIQNKFEFVHMPEIVSITRIHSRQDSVLSPNALTEGNELWIDMVKSLPEETKIQYENTLYNFYYEMVKFLKMTPYVDTRKYCETLLRELEKKSWLDGHDKVSIIIPFYNRVDKTLMSVKSALAQTYQNIEVVLVDDASSEDISEIKQLVDKHENVRLMHMNKNSGPAACRNAGIRNSSGNYIAFLDSDDEFMKNKVEVQLALMIKHNPDVSHTSYIRRSRDGKDTIMREEWLSGVVVPRIVSNCAIATPTVMLKKSFFETRGLSFREDIRVGEDTCLWLDIAKISNVLLVDEPLTLVNVDDNSHAVDASKSAMGLKNIVAYQLNDSYYRNYTSEIAKICKSFFDVVEEKERRERQSLKYKGLRLSNPSSTQERLAYIMRESMPYRVVRKLYNEGPKGVAKATAKKIRGEE